MHATVPFLAVCAIGISPGGFEHGGETTTQIIASDRDTLLWLANQGSIDLHPWLSRKGSLDEPDVCVIDVDAKESPFADALKVARVTGRILREVGLAACVKTSGKSGLHVFVPLAPGYTYDQSRMFAEGVARAVVRELGDLATVARTPGARGGRVYVDSLQNRRSQTIVPPYVPRPVPGAPVSTPLAWDELATLRSPREFTIRTLPARLEQVGDLFAPTLATPQDLLPAIDALARLASSKGAP
jgi:bifunctional non-homologous end joining protein LigD